MSVSEVLPEEHEPCAVVCVCFLRVSLFDYQAMCKMNLHSVSGARPLLSVCTVCLLLTQYYDRNSVIISAV